METRADKTAPLAYSLERAAALVDLSRRSLYRLIDSGELRTVKVGGRRLVPAQELARLVGDTEFGRPMAELRDGSHG